MPVYVYLNLSDADPDVDIIRRDGHRVLVRCEGVLGGEKQTETSEVKTKKRGKAK